MKCENCKKYDDCRTGSGLTWPCGAYVPINITNADRIRSMADEELADTLITTGAFCDKCELDVDKFPCEFMHCRKAAINWLRSPEKRSEAAP